MEILVAKNQARWINGDIKHPLRREDGVFMRGRITAGMVLGLVAGLGVDIAQGYASSVRSFSGLTLGTAGALGIAGGVVAGRKMYEQGCNDYRKLARMLKEEYFHTAKKGKTLEPYQIAHNRQVVEKIQRALTEQRNHNQIAIAGLQA
jgi:hypothetical protein